MFFSRDKSPFAAVLGFGTCIVGKTVTIVVVLVVGGGVVRGVDILIVPQSHQPAS